MEAHKEINGKNSPMQEDGRKKNYYSRLFRKFAGLTLICSLIPLLLVGWAINIHYARFSKSRMMDSFHTQVDYHRRIIELFLKERSSKLQLIAHTHSREYLSHAPNLAHVFEIMNTEYGSITDLGVIDGQGRHAAYIGPYDLMDKDYSEAFWFKEVLDKGLYISDMFMGFRRIPHFIIAVRGFENEKKWVLRATVDTEAFRSLVENVRIGKTGEVYLLNQKGLFQTSPRFSGKLMGKAPFPVEFFHEGIRIRELSLPIKDSKEPHSRQVVAQAWLQQPRWMLVVKQNYSEAFNEVNHANYATLVFLHLSAATILIVTVFMAKHLIKVIKRRDMEANQLSKQLMQAGKLASIGELSAGVAHEINNPLAILLTERQIVLDLADCNPKLDPDFKNQLTESLSQMGVQVHRCKRITQNLLKFSRRTKSVIEPVDLNSFLREVTELMEREAKTSGIKFSSELEEDLHPILSDPSQLQQVFLNVITNAIDAHKGKPYGSIHISTHADKRREGVRIVFSDTGSGISPENLDKVFDPFFTTKSVGKGTGLGLSICYSIIKQLGGDVAVASEVGKGTQFSLFLPHKPPNDLRKTVDDGLVEPPPG